MIRKKCLVHNYCRDHQFVKCYVKKQAYFSSQRYKKITFPIVRGKSFYPQTTGTNIRPHFSVSAECPHLCFVQQAITFTSDDLSISFLYVFFIFHLTTNQLQVNKLRLLGFVELFPEIFNRSVEANI